MSVEVGYVGNRGRHVFAGRRAHVNPNQPTLDGFPDAVAERAPAVLLRAYKTPYLNLGGAFGWTQGIDYFCSCANNWYDSMQARFTRRFSEGYSIQANYTLQKAEGEGGDYFFWDPILNKGVTRAGTAPTRSTSSLVYEVPFGKGNEMGNDWGTNHRLACWAGGSSTPTRCCRAVCPSTSTMPARRRSATPGPNRPDVSGDIKINGGRTSTSTRRRSAQRGSPYSTPAVGTFGNMELNSLSGPGYRRTDASLFKHVRLGGNRDFEIRLEAVNLFNNVNLRNPDSGIGTDDGPPHPRGVIDATAFDNADPQRKFQFGFKFSF